MSKFTKATKTQARLRLALIGPSGSGKTYSALAIATRLGQRVAVIDTERGSAAKYADLFDFDVLELHSFGPDVYAQCIRDAAAEKYDVLVIDSLSHAWMGKDGALERVDAAQKRSNSSNGFAAWREVTPQHNALVDAILAAPMHVVGTIRAKTEYVQEKDDRGKTVIRKVGLAPVQRDGLEYEFDLVGDMNIANELVVTKSRCPALTGGVFLRPGEDVAAILRAWLTDGAPLPEPKAPPLAPKLTEAQVIELLQLANDAGLAVIDQESGDTTYPLICKAMDVSDLSKLPPSEFERCRKRLHATIKRKEEEAAKQEAAA